MMGMGGMGKKSKPNDMWEAWRDIFRYIGRYKVLFIITAALSALASGLALIGPYFISEMTDLIQVGIKGDMDIDEVKRVGYLLITIYLVSGVLSFFENYMMATVSQRCAQMFRRDIARKLNRIPLR